MKNIEYEIELINNIIEESVFHGGDAGGPYLCNGGKVCSAVQKWLNFHDLNEIYTVKDQDYDDGYTHNIIPKIVKKENK